MKNFRSFLSLSALALVATGMASADTIITTNATTVGPTKTDYNFSLIFAPTATPVGTHLVSATLEVDAVISDPTLSLTNNASTSQTFSFTATALARIATNTADTTFVGSSTSPSTVLATGLVTFTPGQSVTYSPLNINEALGPVTVANAAAYLGGATLGGSTFSSTTFVGGGGNIGVSQVQNATINGILKFDFAPNVTTPEPATFAMFGGALVGLGLFRRNRK